MDGINRTGTSTAPTDPLGARETISLRELAGFLRFVRPVWRLGAVSLLLALLAAALGAVLPLSTKVLLDYVIFKRDTAGLRTAVSGWLPAELVEGLAGRVTSLEHVIAAVLLVGGAAAAVRLLQQYLVTRFQERITFNLQAAVFERVMCFPLRFFARVPTGYLMSRILQDVSSLKLLVSQRLEQAVESLFYLACGLGMVFALNRPLAWVAVCFVPWHVLINVLAARPVRRRWHAVMEHRADLSQQAQDSLAGMEVVKAFAGEACEAGRFRRVLERLTTARIRAIMMMNLSQHAVRAVQAVTTLVITWLGVRQIQRGVITIGDLAAFSSYLLYLSGPARSLASLHLGLQPLLASLSRLHALLCQPTEPRAAGSGALPARLRGHVRYAGVHFHYEPGCPVLEEVAFEIAPGETVALVGPSGAGKTTLAMMLPALLSPTEGAVLLDGADVRNLDPAALRRRIGVVPQRSFLFADTIANNIIYAAPDVTREQMVAAARAARVHDEIAALPRGYETRLGSQGSGLSEGQRQRLAVARCLVRRPSLLILDEPVSALDARSEALLRASLADLIRDGTVLMIAHRLTLLDLADRIVVLNAGRVEAMGRLDELLETSALFRELWVRSRGGSESAVAAGGLVAAKQDWR